MMNILDQYVLKYVVNLETWISNLPPNLLASYVFGLSTIFFSVINSFFYLVKSIRFLSYFVPRLDNMNLFSKLVGTFSILSIAFVANHWFVYVLSVIVIATLVTELDFLEKITAVLSKNKEYFDYLKQKSEATEQQVNYQQKIDEMAATAEQIVSGVQTERDNFIKLYHFERTYRLIFGSQIQILRVISNLPQKMANSVLLEAFYRRSGWAGSTYSFRNYMNFLETSFYVKYDPTTDCFVIESLGEEFLNYLTNNQIPENKPL